MSSTAAIPYAPCRNDENERSAIELKRHQAKMQTVRTALQHVRLWFQQSASANAAADVLAGVRVDESKSSLMSQPLEPLPQQQQRTLAPAPPPRALPPQRSDGGVKRRLPPPPPSAMKSISRPPLRLPPPQRPHMGAVRRMPPPMRQQHVKIEKMDDDDDAAAAPAKRQRQLPPVRVKIEPGVAAASMPQRMPPPPRRLSS